MPVAHGGMERLNEILGGVHRLQIFQLRQCRRQIGQLVGAHIDLLEMFKLAYGAGQLTQLICLQAD